MRPKSLILLALALGCGLIAAVGINQILATPAETAQTVSVVVAKAEIKKGDMIKPEDLRLQEWHVDHLPEGAITKIDDLAERRVKTLVVPGEPILESKLVPKGVNGVNEIPSGMKGIAVHVDKVSSGGGLIQPGDNVDVMVHVTANASAGIPQTTTKLLLSNIKVHAVDNVTERAAPGEQPSVAQTVTLCVTPKDATLLTHATEIGRIRLVLRSSRDGDVANDSDRSGVTNGDIFHDVFPELGNGGNSTIAAGGLTPLPPTAPVQGPGIGNALGEGLGSILDVIGKARELGPPEPVEQPWKMIVIEGINSKEMEFDKNQKPVQLSTDLTSSGPSGQNESSSGELPFLKLPPIDNDETETN